MRSSYSGRAGDVYDYQTCTTKRVEARGSGLERSLEALACIDEEGNMAPESMEFSRYICLIKTIPLCQASLRAYSLRRKALPNTIKPKMDRMLSMMGTGFCRRMARGIEDPPRIAEARRLSWIP